MSALDIVAGKIERRLRKRKTNLHLRGSKSRRSKDQETNNESSADDYRRIASDGRSGSLGRHKRRLRDHC